MKLPIILCLIAASTAFGQIGGVGFSGGGGGGAPVDSANFATVGAGRAADSSRIAAGSYTGTTAGRLVFTGLNGRDTANGNLTFDAVTGKLALYVTPADTFLSIKRASDNNHFLVIRNTNPAIISNLDASFTDVVTVNGISPSFYLANGNGGLTRDVSDGGANDNVRYRSFRHHYWVSTSASPTLDTILFLSSSGNLGVGQLTGQPTARLHINAGTATAGTAPLKFTSGTNLTTPEEGAMEYDGTNYYVTVASGPTRQTITTSSDSTMKKDIADLDGSLAKVLALRPVSFVYKTGSDTAQTHYGLLAQQVARVDANYAFYDSAGVARGVRYTELTAVLVRAIQEQDERITALERRNTWLLGGLISLGFVGLGVVVWGKRK